MNSFLRSTLYYIAQRLQLKEIFIEKQTTSQMKKIILLCLVIFTSLSVDAGERITVSLVQQYSDTTFVLPQKSIERKMKCVVAAKPDYLFPKILRDTLEKFQDEDHGNRVFTMLLMGSGKGIDITVQSSDILDNDSTKYFGDFVVDKKHFVMVQNEDNAELLKIFFKKTGNSVLFQRRYVLTHNIVTYMPSSLNAFYNEYDKKLLVRECIINGENQNKINKVIVPHSDTNNDDEDAFKLDVELFE